MRQKFLRCSLLLFIFTFSLSVQVFAAEELKGSSRQGVLTHLQAAFDAQVSLTEKARSKEEIEHILSTYFEEELIEKYMNENVHELDGQFIVYGTDFPMYTIPFFSYDEKTKVHEQATERIVFEFFPASTDGPVGYDDHFEVVKLRKTNEGWKIYSIENETKQPNIPEEQDDIEKKDGEGQSIEIENMNENSKGQSQLKNTLTLNVTPSYIKQSFKEFNDVLLFSSFYLKTKNIINEYVQTY